MGQRCSCGALLCEDARFCHKCGAPQYEEDIARIAEQERAWAAPAQAPLEPPLSSVPQQSVSLTNFRALAITLLMAGIAFLVSGVVAMVSAMLFPVVLVAAGFFAVRVYAGRLSARLPARSGALLGWMTGFWMFIVFALAAVSPGGTEAIHQMQSLPQFSKLMNEDPRQLLTSIAIAGFCLITLLPGLGGLLASLLSSSKGSSAGLRP